MGLFTCTQWGKRKERGVSFLTIKIVCGMWDDSIWKQVSKITIFHIFSEIVVLNLKVWKVKLFINLPVCEHAYSGGLCHCQIHLHGIVRNSGKSLSPNLKWQQRSWWCYLMHHMKSSKGIVYISAYLNQMYSLSIFIFYLWFNLNFIFWLQEILYI